MVKHAQGEEYGDTVCGASVLTSQVALRQCRVTCPECLEGMGLTDDEYDDDAAAIRRDLEC